MFLLYLKDGENDQVGSERVNQNIDATESMPPSLKVVPTIYPTSNTLEEDLSHFWNAGPEFDSIKIKTEEPPQPLALLKRLGPSPFPGGGFPLIGFLATTYDKVSRYAMERLDRSDRPNYE